MPSPPTAPPHLDPPDLLRDVITLDLLAFVGRYGDAPFLLVRLPETDTELALGLTATAASGSANGRSGGAKPLPFRTSHQSAPPGSARRDGRATIAQLMGTNAHFAVPLRKREGSDTVLLGHISVGRAHNKDIVLRHTTISKFHAWFEVDPSDDVFVTDAGSTNLSRVNGRPLDARARTAVAPGDIVRFGAVEAFVCSAETLWACMNPGEDGG